MMKEKEPISIDEGAALLVGLLIEKKKFVTIKSAAAFAAKIEEQYGIQAERLNKRQKKLDKNDRIDFTDVDLNDARMFTRSIISNKMTALEPWSISRESLKMAADLQTFKGGLEDLTVSELRELAESRGIDLEGIKKKADIIDFINENS